MMRNDIYVFVKEGTVIIKFSYLNKYNNHILQV